MINQNFWCGSFQASSNLLHNLSVIELKSTDNSLKAAFISSTVVLLGEDGGGNPVGMVAYLAVSSLQDLSLSLVVNVSKGIHAQVLD